MKKILFLVLFLTFAFDQSQAQSAKTGYQAGKYNLEELDGSWIAPPKLEIFGNNRQILVKALHFSIDHISVAVSVDFQEVMDDKSLGKDQSEQMYNIRLVNDVLVLMPSLEKPIENPMPYVFSVKKVKAQSLVLGMDSQDFVFKKQKQ